MMNEDSSTALIVAVAQWWVSQVANNDLQTGAFSKVLSEYLTQCSQTKGTCILTTAYEPEGSLRDFCEIADIDPRRIAFPQKTVMEINFATEVVTYKIGDGITNQLYPVTV